MAAQRRAVPKLYGELAPWFHLLTAPKDYAEEARLYRKVLREACDRPPQTLLELGSGGGNNASHLKKHFAMTLVDLSPQMLAISRKLNPECEHLQGDMRRVRLGRVFDAVFVHDAIMYMTTERDLRRVFETAFVHCRRGAAALFVPDCERETFRPSAKHGGHDGADGRSLRYLEWTWDPDPSDTTYLVDFAYLLRSPSGRVRAVRDRHIFGLFPRADWLRLLRDIGFRAKMVTPKEPELPGDLFVAKRPGSRARNRRRSRSRPVRPA